MFYFLSFKEFSPPELLQRLQQLWQSLQQLEVTLRSEVLQQMLWAPLGWILSQQQEQTGTEAVAKYSLGYMFSKTFEFIGILLNQTHLKCLPAFPQTDPEPRLGMRSSLLNVTDDGDSKRAKLSYSNRDLYTRTPSTSVTGSTYSSTGLSSGRGTWY